MPCQANRLKDVMKLITDDTVLGVFVSPAIDALDFVRFKPGIFKSLKMEDFITLGILRHVKAQKTLRDQVQELFHLNPGNIETPPLARSTWSDALASPHRRDILRGVMNHLSHCAEKCLEDRLGAFDPIKGRSIYATDGTYQKESSHYRRVTPKNGGTDNPKGHALLTFYDVRLGCPVDVTVETKSRHEISLLKSSNFIGLTEKRSLHLVDRAFIDAPYWNSKKKKYGITMISRMKDSLIVESTVEQDIKPIEANEGVIKDEQIILRSGGNEVWRLVTYCSPEGDEFVFLTNELNLEPGLIAFLYMRRWDEEKCFDTWKNDFAQSKAWSKKPVAIENQTLLAIITNILIALFVYDHATKHGVRDEKALDKQDKRMVGELESEKTGAEIQEKPTRVYQRLFRFTSKTSRQVMRFFRYCFYKTMDYDLIKVHLWPMLTGYI